MYSCYEIKIIFARCVSLYEVVLACDAFEMLINDKAITAEQERFARRESIVRARQIKSVNR